MLRLNYKNENGDDVIVDIERLPFTIGRHSECGLTYTDSRLSREHLRIDEVDGSFRAVDLGSSNGTTLNGVKLVEPTVLKDGDILDLGGGLLLNVAIEQQPESPADEPETGMDAVPALPAAAPAAAMPAPPAADGIPVSFFIIAPLLGIFVLAIVVGAVLLLRGGDGGEITSNTDESGFSTADDGSDEPGDDEPGSTPKPSETSIPVPSGTPLNGGPANSSLPIGGTDLPPPTADTSETAKVERNGATFVRQIAQNDPKAFLTGEQAAKVSSKLKQIGRSPALADNLNSARKNAAAIKALAVQKNLKPQFLAVAAITKLGGSRGDVLQAAQSVADVYDTLGIQIGNENFDDALLMVAAYDQGAAGETMKMRNMLQSLAEKSPEGARTIRSIWFLEKQGKITPAEYDRALNFLAIGTIAQNPKDFGVNAEALRL